MNQVVPKTEDNLLNSFCCDEAQETLSQTNTLLLSELRIIKGVRWETISLHENIG